MALALSLSILVFILWSISIWFWTEFPSCKDIGYVRIIQPYYMGQKLEVELRKKSVWMIWILLFLSGANFLHILTLKKYDKWKTKGQLVKEDVAQFNLLIKPICLPFLSQSYCENYITIPPLLLLIKTLKILGRY